MSDFLGAGRLEDHPFPALAGTIFREGRSGELSLESADRRRSVWFLGGNPVAVISEDPQDHLAQVLLEHGRISADDARRLAAVPETREGLGSVDFLPKETLNWGVKFRFVNLCYDLFRWDEGDYAFHEGNPPKELFLLKVPAHSLIFKGVGYLGQGTVYDAVPDEAALGPGPVPAAEARYLGPDERALLEACRPGRTVAEVLADAGDAADQARRSLYALFCLGLIVLSRAEAVQAPVGGGTGEDEFDLETPAGGPPPVPAPDLSGTGAREFSFDGEEPRVTAEFTLPPLDLPYEPEAAGLSPSDFIAGEALAATSPLEQEFRTDAGDPFASSPPSGGGAAAPGTGKPERGGKKPKSGRGLRLPRLAGILLGTLGAAAVIGAASWWWISSEETPQPPVRLPARPAAKTAPPPAAPAPAPDSSPAPAVPPPADPGAPPATSAAPPAEPTPLSAPPERSAPAAPAAAVPSADRYRNGLEVFRAGDLDGAATIWESLLSESHRGDFTLLLMTACQHETIREAQRTFSSRRLYLVGKKVNGRSCFRVCLDTFDSRDAADRALSGLAAEYRSAGAAVRPVSDVLTAGR